MSENSCPHVTWRRWTYDNFKKKKKCRQTKTRRWRKKKISLSTKKERTLFFLINLIRSQGVLWTTPIPNPKTTPPVGVSRMTLPSYDRREIQDTISTKRDMMTTSVSIGFPFTPYTRIQIYTLSKTINLCMCVNTHIYLKYRFS